MPPAHHAYRAHCIIAVSWVLRHAAEHSPRNFKMEQRSDLQRTCASGFTDAAKLTYPGALCAPRTPRGRHPLSHASKTCPSQSGGIVLVCKGAQKGHNICTCTWDTLFGLFRSGSLSLPLSLSLSLPLSLPLSRRGAHRSPTPAALEQGPPGPWAYERPSLSPGCSARVGLLAPRHAPQRPLTPCPA